MKNPKKILIIIQRSNGDVFLSLSLINELYDYFHRPRIDLLVNDDTLPVARLLPNINRIHKFSYQKKFENRWTQESQIFKKIFRKYDLSINLTASDRSVLYAILASYNSISAVELSNKKSWWKKFFLRHYYYFDSSKHILKNNLEPLNLLQIQHTNILQAPKISKGIASKVRKKLDIEGIKKFVIFHPSAQYEYKVYPMDLRNKLLRLLSNLNIIVVVTGGENKIDQFIKESLPSTKNVFNWIGQTSIEEYIALCNLSDGYIGMDTLNMHIASSLDKRIFAIFGPTKLSMWSPWSNKSQKSANNDMPIQTYSNVTIFQANMPCVACGHAGCNNNMKTSECLKVISPQLIANEVENWYKYV